MCGACDDTELGFEVPTSSGSGSPCAPSPRPFMPMALTRRRCWPNDDAVASGDINTTVANTRQNIERILAAEKPLTTLRLMLTSQPAEQRRVLQRCSHARPMRWAAAAIARPLPLIPSHPHATRHAWVARYAMCGRAPGWGGARGLREDDLALWG
jgi:hypothetical protein